MALMKCPECNKEISDTTNVCIHCGYKIGSNSQIYIHPFVKKIVPIIIYKEIDTYNTLIYGLNIHSNPTLSLLEKENKKRLLRL